MTANFPAPLPPAGPPSDHPQPAPTTQQGGYQQSGYQQGGYQQAGYQQPGQQAPSSGTYQAPPQTYGAADYAQPYQLLADDRPRRPIGLIIAAVLTWCGGGFLLLVGVVVALAGPELIASDPSMADDPVFTDFPDWGLTAIGVAVIIWAVLIVLGGVLAFCRQLAGAILLAVLTLAFAVLVLSPPIDAAVIGVLVYCLAATVPMFLPSALAFYRGRKHQTVR